MIKNSFDAHIQWISAIIRYSVIEITLEVAHNSTEPTIFKMIAFFYY